MQLDVAYILFVFESPDRSMMKKYLRDCWPGENANFIEEHMDAIEHRYLAASTESLGHLLTGACELFAQSTMKKTWVIDVTRICKSWRRGKTWTLA